MKLNNYRTTFFILSLGLTLIACDSGGAGGEGAALDSSENIALITPLVGTYDLQDDWNFRTGDQAFLVIREPTEDGTAEADLFDIDDIDNCVLQPVTGVVSVDRRQGVRIFLDNILNLDQSVLSLSAQTLTIEYLDVDDRNNNGDTVETISVSGQRVGLTDQDFGPDC